jgi:sec-independent protein translocase protein TatA
MVGIGISELLVIVIVALLVFGPKRLPEIGQALGQALAEFRRAISNLSEESNDPQHKREEQD